ncbi:MAG: putative bifunctional diguanylate cyclase/phosphodiesterase [Spirochaeta sp.]
MYSDTEIIPEDLAEAQALLNTRLQQIAALNAELDTVRMQKMELEHQLERSALRRRDLENLLSLHEKTGLPTHFRLKTELQQTLEHINRSDEKSPLSVMILHLDTTINTLQRTTKTSISEWVLYQLGNRFLEAITDEEQVFHTRDSEFVFLLREPHDDNLYRKIKLIFHRLREPFVFSNIKVTLDGWAGIALYPDHGITRSVLMRHADIALGTAAEQRRSTVIFQEQLMYQVIEKIDLQNSIIRAIEAPAMKNIGRQFSLQYQPKVFFADTNEDSLQVSQVEGEALMRWNHPEKGSIAPDRFIPLAEETGLIMPMGKWVMYTAVQQILAWIEAGIDDVPIAINLSARQMQNDDILDITRSLIENRNLPGSQIIFEVTETSIFEDPQSARRLMDGLTELGVRISIDDFGTGYSSLSYLSRFPVHEIKVDRSFISRFLHSQADDAIIRSIAHLAHQMNWNVVAEGVEHIDEVNRLRGIGIHCFQGYYFSRPLSPENFAGYIQKLRSNGMHLPQD